MVDAPVLAMWDVFRKDAHSKVLNSHQSLLEASQTKEKFVVDEVEDIIKYLEGIYRIVGHPVSEITKRDGVNGNNDHDTALIWKLDKAMEAALGIARVSSSSIHNLGRAIYYSNREKIAIQKHKSSGYFASLRDSETSGKKNRRNSTISFEDSFKMFSDAQNNHETHQILSSMKLSDVTDEYETEDDNSFTESSDENDEHQLGISVTLLNKISRTSAYVSDSLRGKKPPGPYMITKKVASFNIK